MSAQQAQSGMSYDAGRRLDRLGEADGKSISLRKQISAWILYSNAGFYMDTIQTVLSLLACCVYVVSTYEEARGPLPQWIIAMELFFFTAFTCDYLLHLFIAENRPAYIFSTASIIDLLSILPIAAIGSTANVGFLRVLRVFRVVRILRGYRAFTPGTAAAESASEGASRQLGVLSFVLMSFMFIGGGFVHSMELLFPGSFQWPGSDVCTFEEFSVLEVWEYPPECQLTFLDAVYFVIITATTVGFGDIGPTDAVGRVVVLAVLIPLFIVVPREVSKLLELLERQSVYDKAYRVGLRPHVVVTGDLSYSVALAFLAEFYHEDHGEQKMKVVLLGPHDPSPALESLINNPVFHDNVQYVRGSPLSSHDLSRVEAASARAAFVLTSQFAADPVFHDISSILIVKSIKAASPWIPTYCQLVSPEAKQHDKWVDWDFMLCVKELRMGIIAKSTLCPGFTALVSNLISSSTDFPMRLLPENDRMWLKEYVHGSQQELYSVSLSASFQNMLFVEAVNKSLLLFGVCLIGVETQLQRESRAVAPRRGHVELRRLASGEVEPEELTQAASAAAGEPGTSDFDTLRRFFDADLDDDEVARREAERVERSKLGGAAELPDEEIPMARWKEERRRRDNTVVLLNPKDYILRRGDRALVIAADSAAARMLHTWRGRVMPALRDITSVSPAEKTTFQHLNNGRGPLLRDAMPRLVPIGQQAAEDGPEKQDEEAEQADEGAAFDDGDSEQDDEVGEGAPMSSAEPGRPFLRGMLAPAGAAAPSPQRPSRRRARSLPKRHGAVADARDLGLRNHIVICGAITPAVGTLLQSIRAEAGTPVVVLHQAADGIPMLSAHPSALDMTFFVRGSPLSVSDLERAGLEHATVAVVLANPDMMEATSVVDAQSSQPDLEAVFAACVIESSFKHCRTIVEMASLDSMKFLEYKPLKTGLPRTLWPQFACGRIYNLSALDTLLCQAFYNPALVPVISGMISGQPAETGGQAEEARGFDPRTVPQHSCVVHMQVPVPFVNRCYKDLFTELVVTKGILPVGLYRCKDMQDSVLPYVMTNPPPLTTLHVDDRLFVMVSRDMLANANRLHSDPHEC